MQQAAEARYYTMLTGDDGHGGWESSALRRDVLTFIREHASSRSKLLELGCGTATIVPYLPKSVSYHGADVSGVALGEARKRYGKEERVHLTRLEPTSHTLPFNDTYDFVLAVWALEHFAHPREFLAEMVRVCARGGFMILIAPNHEFPLSYPNALRHRGSAYRVYLTLARIGDYLLRLAHVWRFRVLASNYTEATGHYEKPDDDLKYLTSTYEVVGYLASHGMEIVRADRPHPITGGRRLRKKLRMYIQRFIATLPAMRYYGVSLFVIARKGESSTPHHTPSHLIATIV